jgi:inhibitor of KinA
MDIVDENLIIYYLSEQAVTVEFGQEIGKDILKQIRRLNHLLQQNPFPGFRTTVPAYTTLSIFFDPVQTIKNPDLPGRDCFEKVSAYLRQLKNETGNEEISMIKTVSIPVCYGGTFGPDLDEVAKLNNLTVKEVITLHAAAIYEVYMIGFIPGFAYLGGMPEILSTPRKLSPRKAVPAGSVGIAGKQTGIYPLETPGGWQIIGQTPLTLFNAEKAQPALLNSGDRVIFKQISQQQFELYRD